MKKMIRFAMYMIMAIGMMAATSCSVYATPAEKQAILNQFRTMKTSLPQTINAGMAITDVNIRSGNTVELTIQLSKEYLEEADISQSTMQSDRNIARGISSFDDDVINGLVRNGLSLKYVYTSGITGKKIAEITLTPQKLSDIKRRVKNGTLKPYTVLELTRLELSRMNFPQKVTDGAWITSGYVKGHNLYYTMKFEADIDSSVFPYEVLQEMKRECIEELQNDAIFQINKNDMRKENIHIVYILQNISGEEVARVDISPSELFPSGSGYSTDNRYTNI